MQAWAVGLCAFACSGQAFANGRFPTANQLVVDPVEPAHLMVRATFGLLQTFDAGASWTWVCEEAISQRTLVDPEAVIMGDGGVLLGLVDGIALGDKTGCAWSRATSGVDGHAVNDLIRHPDLLSRAYATLILPLDGLYAGQVVMTDDAGRTWAPVGEVLMDTYPVTIEIARSRPERLYLGANDSSIANGSIGVSDDGGRTFVLRAPPAGSDSIYVSAVDPGNADRLYVRSYYPESNLYVSDDAGLSYTLIYRSTSALTGFALSPDGARVAVGDQTSVVILSRQATDAGSAYGVEQSYPMNVTCLGWTARGLYACATEASDGFSLGLSTDGAKSFAPLLRFADLRPVTCPRETSGARCTQSDCALATLFRSSCEGDVAPPDEGTPVVATGGAAGAPADAASPAPSPEPRGAAPDASDAPVASVRPAARSCDCDLMASGTATRDALYALAICAIARLRARRRAPQPPPR